MVDQADKAMEWIEKGFEVRDPNMPYIATPGYLFEPLFDNPRFIEIIRENEPAIAKRLVFNRKISIQLLSQQKFSTLVQPNKKRESDSNKSLISH